MYALKKQLVDSFYGMNRGLSASTETRGDVVELISQLEAKNPTPAPTEALPLLNGKWILVYTTFSGLFPLLSRGATLSLVKVEEISQTINSESFTVQNSVLFSGHWPQLQSPPALNSKSGAPNASRMKIVAACLLAGLGNAEDVQGILKSGDASLQVSYACVKVERIIGVMKQSV